MSAIRVLMLGLDAADWRLVERFVGDGRMPNLATLVRQGVRGRLESPADLYAGGVWPTFYTGCPVEQHGVFHNKQWRPETMRVETPRPDWTNSLPFWERWRDNGIESLIVDVPMVLGQPPQLRGTYLGGWGTHDLVARGSWPSRTWRDLVSRHGPPVMPREAFGWQTETSLARLESELHRATAQFRDVAIDLMTRQSWQFACIVFGSLHRGGHYLWDRSQLPPFESLPDSTEPDAVLVDLYRGIDAALGELLAHVPSNTLVIAFALHGMGPNPGWSDVVPDLLHRWRLQSEGQAPRRGPLYRLRQSIPQHWARPVLDRVPLAWTQRLTELWSRGMFDWRTTRHFPVPMDESAYLRVNLRGRENEGIVGPGRDYEDACAALQAMFASLRDERTGRPIAGTGTLAYREASPDSAGRRLLPDVVFPFSELRAGDSTAIVSTLLPGFRHALPTRLPSGRSGNHRAQGWFVAAGPDIESGRESTGHHIVDLLPTIEKRLGLPSNPRLLGQAITAVCG